MVRQPVKHRAGQSLAAEHLGPLLEWQVRRDDDARPFVGRRDHVEEQLAAQLAGWDVAQLVEDQQVKLRELDFHVHHVTFLTGFHQLRNQFGHAMEPDLLAEPSRGDPERGGNMRLTSTIVMHLWERDMCQFSRLESLELTNTLLGAWEQIATVVGQRHFAVRNCHKSNHVKLIGTVLASRQLT